MKIIVGIAAVALLAIGCSDAKIEQQAATPEARTVALEVKGMSCFSCVRTIKNAVNDLPGITECEVSLDDDAATITFFPDSTSSEKLLQTIEDAGYTVALK